MATEATPQPRLSLRQKLFYSSGSFLDQAGLHAVNMLAYPVFNVILGLSPALIGFSLAAFRLWDAVTDPIVGFLTDRVESRWGRRKPFMVVGAGLCAVLFPLAYFADPAWSQAGLTTWFIGIGLLYFTALTVYAIPYQALGLELVPDYDERTVLFTVRTVVTVLGFMAVGWVYPLAQYDFFGSPLEGVRWLTVFLGLFFFGTALIPVLKLRERFGQAAALPGHGAAKGGIRQALGSAFRNRSYVHLAVLQVVLVFGTNVVNALGFYITLHFLYGGNAKAAAPLMGVSGTLLSVVTIASLPLVPALVRRFGKVEVVAMCLGLQLLGSALKWPCFTPALPWLSLIPSLLVTLGNMGFWTLAPAMVSDICDIEEVSTGNRREGLYASVTQWMNKLGYTAATALSGMILVWVGFSSTAGDVQSEETLWWIRFLFVVVPASAFVVGLTLLRGIALSRKRLHEVRHELESRRGVL